MEPNINPAPTPEPTTQPITPTEPSAAPGTEPVVPATAEPTVAAPQTAESPNPAPTAESAPASEPESAPSSGGGKRILLVEDDDSLANVYTQRLEAEGFEVRRVPNGEEALAAALNYKPDLVVLDVMMPKVSGFDVLDILRNTPETANLKVIMLTALSQESDVERAKQLGVDEYLVKSQVVIADVVDKIREHLT